MNPGLLLVCTFFVAGPLVGILLALLEIAAELRIHNNNRRGEP